MVFEIYQPRWKDRTVLLAKYKVQMHNVIKFKYAKSMGTEPYYLHWNDIKNCSIESNGKLDCYCVPLDKLSKLEIAEE